MRSLIAHGWESTNLDRQIPHLTQSMAVIPSRLLKMGCG